MHTPTCGMGASVRAGPARSRIISAIDADVSLYYGLFLGSL